MAWHAVLRRLLENGQSVVLAQPEQDGGPDAPYEIIKERDAADFIPVGKEITLDGRRMIIDSVDFQSGKVSLRDGELQGWYPVFRTENVPFVRGLVEEAEQKELETAARESSVDQMLDAAVKSAQEQEQRDKSTDTPEAQALFDSTKTSAAPDHEQETAKNTDTLQNDQTTAAKRIPIWNRPCQCRG